MIKALGRDGSGKSSRLVVLGGSDLPKTFRGVVAAVHISYEQHETEPSLFACTPPLPWWLRIQIGCQQLEVRCLAVGVSAG